MPIETRNCRNERMKTLKELINNRGLNGVRNKLVACDPTTLCKNPINENVSTRYDNARLLHYHKTWRKKEMSKDVPQPDDLSENSDKQF